MPWLVAQRGQAWSWVGPASDARYAIGALRIARFLLAERRAGNGALLALRLSVACSAAGRAIRTAYTSASPSVRGIAGRRGALGLASSGSQTALNDTAFRARLNPVLAEPFRPGCTSALDIAFLVAALVVGAAPVLALVIRELPLRTTVAASSAEHVEQ